MLDEASSRFLAELAAGGVAPVHELTPVEARAAGTQMAELYGEGPRMGRAEDVTIAARGGEPLGLRLLVPEGDVRGVIVYYHGGGWVLGSLDQFDTLGRILAERTMCAVVLVDYRLAPEHPYPTAVDDAGSALEWAAANVESIAGSHGPADRGRRQRGWKPGGRRRAAGA